VKAGEAPATNARMKISAYSWILGIAYLLCGMMSFRILTMYAGMFSGVMQDQPQITNVVLFIGPFGWLTMMVLLGVFVLIKDLKFQRRGLDLLFAVLLALLVFCLWWPMIYRSSILANTIHG
jgi:hypothetical protein